MAGKINKMIEHLIAKKSNNDASLIGSLNAKLCLKGVVPKRYDASSPDDPVIIEKLNKIAEEWGISMAGV